MQQLNFQQIWRYREQLWDGIQVTLELTVIAVVAGLAIGLAGALLTRHGPKPVKLALRAYVEVFRNTPSLIQLFVVFFILPGLGLRMPPFVAAALALSLYFGAYAIEILRAGLDSIPRSQIEAGHCLGLSTWQVYRHIVLAPALRNVYPALGTQLVILLLGTSLASQVSAEDLFHAGSFIESRTYRSFEVYAVICGIYFTLVLITKALLALAGSLAFTWPVRR
ncbi:amino acid ABC transporter permease [Achromobacter sp. PD1]|uniref:amino acid ABC transporter permease n=1 Tax=Achromobacter sp. PD1 TaxID=3399125 RepID=UPI003AF9A878